MFASSCISETEELHTSKYRVFMVIGESFSITLGCLGDNHWSDDQQVNCLMISWFCSNVCDVNKNFACRIGKLSLIYWIGMCLSRSSSKYNRTGLNWLAFVTMVMNRMLRFEVLTVVKVGLLDCNAVLTCRYMPTFF
jgi:hypothetical protein